VPGKGLVERRMSRFLREPPTVRAAARIIVAATIVVVIGSGILISALDHNEYPNVWIGMWWTLQTVTTVGYGDVPPVTVIGRVITAVIMLWGVAFIAIVTAAITSTFVARARRETVSEESKTSPNARFDELERKLDRIEAALQHRDR
jgi:voltage-gated potassium channel